MKLWKASIEIDVLYASDKEPTDTQLYAAAAKESASGKGLVYGPFPVRHAGDLPEFTEGVVPYGDAGGKTCEQINHENLEAARAKAAEK